MMHGPCLHELFSSLCSVGHSTSTQYWTVVAVLCNRLSSDLLSGTPHKKLMSTLLSKIAAGVILFKKLNRFLNPRYCTHRRVSCYYLCTLSTSLMINEECFWKKIDFTLLIFFMRFSASVCLNIEIQNKQI